MADMRASLVLTADASGFVGEVKGAQEELTGLAQTVKQVETETNQLGGVTEKAGDGLAGVGDTVTKMKPPLDGLARQWTINRIGLMELQAAGINSFQALAAGMDPVHVAAMEMGQVFGALVQGGVLASAGARGLLAAITPLAPAVIVATTAIAALVAGLTIWKPRAQDAAEATKAYRDAIEDGTTAEELFAKAIKAGNEAMKTRGQLLDEDAKKQHESNLQIAQGVYEAKQQELANAQRRLTALSNTLGYTQETRDIRMRSSPTDPLVVEFKETTKAVAELTKQVDEAHVALVNLKSPYIAGGQFAADAEAAALADKQMIEAIQRGHDDLDQHLKDQWESDKQAAYDRRQFILASEIELTQEINKELEERKKQQEAWSKAFVAAVTEAAAAYSQLIDQGQQLTQSLLTPQERYNQSIAQYQTLLDAGVISQQTFNRALDAAGKQLKSMDPLGRELADDLTQGFDRVGSAITEMSLKGENAFEDLGNIGTAVASELAQAFWKLAVINPIVNSLTGSSSPVLGDILDSLFGSGVATNSAGYRMTGAGPGASGSQSWWAGIFHEGGEVGRGGKGRYVDPTMFDGARRLHSGDLRPGERPVIARDGEEIGWPDQFAAKYGGGTQVIINNSTGQPARQEQRQGPDGKRQILVYIGEAAAQDIATGGRMSQQLERTYGLKRGRS